jgi:hypothetical protein
VNRPPEDAILTLEPFMDAVREGVESAGWELSGMQKTTSHQFEGRWEGDSSRSAYLFFHFPDGPDSVSVDVFLDDTSKGLTGNVALVVDLVPLGALADIRSAVMGELGRLSAEFLPTGHRTPVTLRFRLGDGSEDPDRADSEVRFKLRFPRRVLESGASAVSGLALTTVRAFEALMHSPGLASLVPED